MEDVSKDQIFVDKTDYILNAIKEFLLNEINPQTKVNYYKLMGEIEYTLKIRFVEQERNISHAAKKLYLKRSSLAEYLRKISYKKEF